MDVASVDSLADQVLVILNDQDQLDSRDIARRLNVDHQSVVGAIKSLETHPDLLNSETVSHKAFCLTPEGKEIVHNGSHEAVIWRRIPEAGVPFDDIITLPNAKLGVSKAMSAGWIKLDKIVGPKPMLFRKVDNIDDKVQEALLRLQNMQLDEVTEQMKTDLKKRKLIAEVVSKSFVLSRGPAFTIALQKPEADLTAELLTDNAWQACKFKPYNFDALGLPVSRGHLHPLLQVRSEFRQIFLEMGFSEMNTSQYVESSFWNFDALFQPQQHPARDAQDTFFVSDPAVDEDLPEEYVKRTARVHSTGDYGSVGYKYDWKLSEAQKNILRTHTTATSARLLYQLGQQKPFKPAKYFSIDRVFRNETLDSTHLAEFHQIEGVIADYNLSLGHLFGILHEFFKKLGIEKLRFKPAYNPYTEPSMEVYSYHEHLKKWVEVGNSGMFRPEVLLPMGLPSDVNVLAWGLSLERPTMIKYGISNIRDLIGPRVDLKMTAAAPVCQFTN